MDNNCTPSEKSGKKLVQARLPFKVLSTTEKNELVLDSTEKIKPIDSNVESETKSNLKEDYPETKIKLVTDEIVLLSDDDEDIKKDDVREDDLQKNRSFNLDKQKTPDQKSTKVFIKLPISSKKKKRKSIASDVSIDNVETVKISDIKEKLSERKCNANKKVKISNFIVKEKFNDGSSVINNTSLSSDKNKNLEVLCISKKTCDKSKNPNELNQDVMEIDDSDGEETTGSFKSILTDIKSDEDKTNEKLENTQTSPEETNKNENTSNKTTHSQILSTHENNSLDSNKTDTKVEENHEANSSKKCKEQIQEEDKELDDSIMDSNLDLTGNSDLETSVLTDAVDLNNSKSSKRTRNKTNIKTTNERSTRQSTSRPKIDVKEQERLEKEDQKRKEKEAREQKKLQEKLEREAKEQKRIQEKFEKEEMRRKEREEKEKKRLAEIEARNEEKRLKEEEKRKKEELKEEERRKKEEMKEEDRKKKEEERKKREEEKKKKELEKEEMENKKRKAAEVFTKFFVPTRNPRGADENISLIEKVDNNFMPFQIKDDMKLAPIVRKFLNSEEKIAVDQSLDNERSTPSSDLYIKKLKSNNYQSLKSGRTLPTVEDDEVIIVDEVHGTSQCIDANSKCSKKYRAKFFMFCENRRPPYYGTWRKKSTLIKPRKPFQTDKTIFDYEIDSDLEWEEEEPGESLSSSDNEKESEDEYEVDNEFFVPHGHLSDEELEEEEDQSPEVQKAKLKILQQEFASEMKKKTEKLKPRLIGVVWRNKDLSKPESCPTIVWDFLKERQMILNSKIRIVSPKENITENNSPNQQDKPIKLLKRTELPEEYTSTLIKLVHGNPNNKLFIIKEFQAYLTKNNANSENVQFTKSCIREKIESMSQWKVMKNKSLKKKFLCYVVSKEFLEKYDLGDLDIQNKWEYIIPPKIIAAKDNLEEEETTITPSKPVKAIENSPVITKFAKVLRKEKKEKLLEENNEDVKLITNEKNVEIKNPKVIQNNKNIDTTTATSKTLSSTITPSETTTLTTVSSTSIIKKRVPILFSGPRGQKVPEESKKNAVNDFLKQTKTSQKSSPNSIPSALENDECIVIE